MLDEIAELQEHRAAVEDKDLLGVIDALEHPAGINAAGKQVVRRALVELQERRKADSEREQVRSAHAEWSLATFGDVGPVGPLKHLSKEAMEAAAEPDDHSEWADMQFLLWDAQRRAGISDEQITQAMVEKLAVNKQREWPEPKDGEPRLHIKEQPAPVVPEYPETLPCPVLLEPGMRFGKGVKTRLVLEAIQRRAEHYAELEAMTPEQRAEHDAGIEAIKAMLPKPAQPDIEMLASALTNAPLAPSDSQGRQRAPVVPDSENGLMPCPFCGGKAHQLTIEQDDDPHFGGDVITCTECWASSHVEFGFKENLKSAWNSRTAMLQGKPDDEVGSWNNNKNTPTTKPVSDHSVSKRSELLARHGQQLNQLLICHQQEVQALVKQQHLELAELMIVEDSADRALDMLAIAKEPLKWTAQHEAHLADGADAEALIRIVDRAVTHIKEKYSK